MFYLTFSMMPSVDLACYGISHAQDIGIWRLSYKLKLRYFWLLCEKLAQILICSGSDVFGSGSYVSIFEVVLTVLASTDLLIL